ncbi:MAG: family 20 glycosylhydrolase [Actinomycetales bacterium]|nr:family 20 glycosylhydrolase [Actinomycetales bacterium]
MAGVPILPAPVRGERRAGRPFLVDATTRVVVAEEPEAVCAAVLLAHRIGRAAGGPVPVGHRDDGEPGAVVLRLAEPGGLPLPPGLAPDLAAEAYRVEVDHARVVVTAAEPVGLLRGLAALDQVAVPVQGGLAVPSCAVLDHPRFAWRGLCLDVARHWFAPETLRDVVLLLASLRMNTLHLHLTDDQGWRIETPSRPRLTEVAAATSVGGDPGGFLSRPEYAALVVFAAAHGVTVVPEIDVPGHVNAALHAYGSLTPSGEPRPPYTGVGVGFSRLHAEVADTLPFLTDVLGDVAAVTPGPYVHIGGDEALTMHAAEYDQLVGHAAGVVVGAGKTVVAWQEAARARLPAGSIVQYWDEQTAPDAVLAAVRDGARVLLSPAGRAYLDTRYDRECPVGSEWSGRIGLRACYEWEPADVLALPDEDVVGVEAAIWTETVATPRDLFWLLLPRLAAIAEVAWSAPERRGWPDFERRLRGLTARWDLAGVPWYRPGLET